MKPSKTSAKFLLAKEQEWKNVGIGIQRQIMAYDERVMLVNVQFEKGAVGVLHEHYHTQVTYIAEGIFEVTIDGETQTLQAGDSFYIPPHAIHGVVCLEAGLLVDVFSPMREDFMNQ
jgi:quercetin dioxygenase-like cupin family protein|nr:cupin domain-containing protein [uncultured Flavobacterium sp.]